VSSVNLGMKGMVSVKGLYIYTKLTRSHQKKKKKKKKNKKKEEEGETAVV
jgi:hypothetical protein